MAAVGNEIRFGGAAEGGSSMKHHGPGGAFFRPAEDISLMRLSPSGMSRRGSSGDLDVNPAPLRESSPANGMSRFSADVGSAPAAAYVGPFGHLGEDPDADHAAVMTDHGPHDDA